jgi:hypothetical protein
MRQFSELVSDQLAKKHGLKVSLFIGVKWKDDAEVYYSGTEMTGTQKNLIDISGLETTTRIEGSGASQTVTVTLSDTDGALLGVLDTIDIHKRPAKVYLAFAGIPIDQAVTLIDGEINSDMVWDDRARTLTFTILSKIEGRLFGFAAEDGLFVDVDSDTRSTPWPFRFGETCAFPAVEIRNGVVGLLRIGQGVLDATLDAKICQAQSISCPLIDNPLAEANEPASEENPLLARQDWDENNVPGTDGPFVRQPTDSFGFKLTTPLNANGESAGTGIINPNTEKPLIRDRECERNKFETLCQLYRDRANQLVYVNEAITILGGEQFPQLQPVTIRIDDVVYEGSFNGELFTITSTNRQDIPDGNIDCTNIDPLTQGYRDANESQPDNLTECQEPTKRFELRVVGGAGQAWRALGDIEDSSFKWLPSGSKVHLESTQTRVHIVSMITGTIDGVFAYRTFGDTRQLTEVPTDYYEVVTTNYGDLTVEEIHLERSLQSYTEGWEEKLYVQFTSDVGPNPRDVIEWIVDNYTDFTIDTESFDAVEAYLTNYPCNFYHASKTNVLDVLNQIAYEARCALFITDNVVKLSYLPVEPAADVTMTGADIVAGSFEFHHTRTENLITSTNVTWQPWGTSILSQDSPIRDFTVENNVEKYGYFGRSEVYDTITNEDQALKTATFWSIRDSNTWRIVTFQTTLEHMNLELFDCIQLNRSGFPNTKCVVRAMSVEPNSGIVTLECWTPILSGSTTEYMWAWPSQQPVEPYPDNNFQVDPPIISISPPTDHPLWIDTNGNPVRPPTTGDRFPSDLDDVFPVTECQDMNDPLLIDAIEPIFGRIGFLDLTEDQAEHSDGIAANNPSVNFEESEENVVCGRNSLEDCVWEVNVQYGTATTIAKAGNTTGTQDSGCDLVGGPCGAEHRGQRCGGPTFFWCRTFGSDTMAQSFVDSINAQINAGFCSWTAGTTGPVGVIGPTKRAAESEAGPACVGMGNTETGNQQE